MWRWMKARPWIWLLVLVAVLLALDVAFILLAQQSPPEILEG